MSNVIVVTQAKPFDINGKPATEHIKSLIKENELAIACIYLTHGKVSPGIYYRTELALEDLASNADSQIEHLQSRVTGKVNDN